MGRTQNVHALLACPEMDVTMRPPTLLPLMEAIMGKNLCAEEHSVMLRAPNPDGDTECRWHRDANRENTGDAEPPYYTRYLSIVFYLTDVDDTTHTFSVLPGTAQSTELFPLEAYDLRAAQHLVGPAGTAILFNASTFHAGNVRQTTAERRTIHIYCGRTTDRYLSNHTIFPRRLWEGKDDATQHYYSRPNPNHATPNRTVSVDTFFYTLHINFLESAESHLTGRLEDRKDGVPIFQPSTFPSGGFYLSQ